MTRDRRHVTTPETHCLHAGPATEDVSVTLERLLDPGLESGHDGVHLGDQGLGGGHQQVQQVAGVGHAHGLLLSLVIGQGLIAQLLGGDSEAALEGPDNPGEEGLG